MGIENLIILVLWNICWITDLTNLLSINSIYKREDILKHRKNNIWLATVCIGNCMVENVMFGAHNTRI